MNYYTCNFYELILMENFNIFFFEKWFCHTEGVFKLTTKLKKNLQKHLKYTQHTFYGHETIYVFLALLGYTVIFWFLDSKVAGERYVYKFVCDPEALFSMAFPDNQRPVLKTDLERQINEEDTVPLSHFDENMAYIQEGGYCNPHPYNEGYVYWQLLQEQSGRFETKPHKTNFQTVPHFLQSFPRTKDSTLWTEDDGSV